MASMSVTAPAILLACHHERTWGSTALLFPVPSELLREVFSDSISCVRIASKFILGAILEVRQDRRVCARMPIGQFKHL